MKEFEIIVDGEKRVAHLVTRIDVEELKLEYIYYYLKEDGDNDSTQKVLMASRVHETEDGFDEIIPIETEEERKLAFKIYQDTYKDAEKASK